MMLNPSGLRAAFRRRRGVAALLLLPMLVTVSVSVPSSVVLPIASIPLSVAVPMPLVVVGARLLALGGSPLLVRAEGGRSLPV